LRRMAQKAGLSEVVVVGSNLRVVGAELADSVQVRLQRMYPGARYLRAAKAVMAPMPSLADTDDTTLLEWTSQLLVSIFGAEVLAPASTQSGEVAS
jgi:transcription-repair coupling factor (superfamily II helicase)